MDMVEEYSLLMKNYTFDLIPLSKEIKLVQLKWVYHTKYAIDGSIDKYKAHVVAKGFSHVKIIDYSKKFYHITKMDSIHLVLSFVASQGWSLYQMDVKSSFLHGDLHDDYMEILEGFV